MHTSTSPSTEMSARTATRPVLAAVAACVAGLVLAAALTPEQSPILPIEVCVVLAALGTWVWFRGSRPSYAAVAAAGVLLTALTVHILTGDVAGSTGARELVPDVVVLAATLALVATAGRALLREARD